MHFGYESFYQIYALQLFSPNPYVTFSFCDYVFSAFEGAKGVESLSGKGLMVGIKTSAPVGEVLSKCIEKGVLCLSAKDKLRLLPALNISWDELKNAVDITRTSHFWTKYGFSVFLSLQN